MSIAKPNTILKYRLKMMEKLGFDENQSQLLALGSLDLETSDIDVITINVANSNKCFS